VFKAIRASEDAGRSGQRGRADAKSEAKFPVATKPLYNYATLLTR